MVENKNSRSTRKNARTTAGSLSKTSKIISLLFSYIKNFFEQKVNYNGHPYHTKWLRRMR